MFADVVTLYRAASRPKIIDGRFAFTGSINQNLKEAISGCEKLDADSGLGYFADGPDYENDQVEFTWALSGNEYGRFYIDLFDFLEPVHDL